MALQIRFWKPFYEMLITFRRFWRVLVEVSEYLVELASAVCIPRIFLILVQFFERHETENVKTLTDLVQYFIGEKNNKGSLV